MNPSKQISEDTADAAPSPTGPRALTRLLALFDVLSQARNGMNLAEISVALDSPKSSLLNLLRPLVAEGFLTYKANTYNIGAAMFRLSASVMQASRLNKLIRPFMQELVDTTGETSMWGELSRQTGEVIFTDVVDSPHALRLQLPAGVRRPLCLGPSGWVLLAYVSKSWRDEYLLSAEQAGHMQPPITRTLIQREITKLRADGLISSIDIAHPGIGSIVAPVFNNQDQCLGVINVAGPANRFRSNLAQLQKAIAGIAQRATAAAKQEDLDPPV